MNAAPRQATELGAAPSLPDTVPDFWLLALAAALAALGVVMVASTSMHLGERQFGQPFHYLTRHAVTLVLGALGAWAVWHVPLRLWERCSTPLFLLGLALLAALLVPGVGRTVNGSTRWLGVAGVSVQVTEPMKLLLVVFMAADIVRRGAALHSTWRGFVVPVAWAGLTSALALAEPDFGAAFVLAATAMAMLFLGGMRLAHCAALAVAALVLAALAVRAAPYRLARLEIFLDPWSDPFDKGFQLTQALIAVGRGDWFGVGLGAGVQKLFYLPEAHTDFMFSVLAEETGLGGALAVIALFALLVWRAWRVAALAERAQQAFAAYLAYGLALWFGLQAFVSIGVNMGLLPPKGLTLPLMSYGSNSLVVMCAAVGLLLRAHREANAARGAP